MKIPLNDIDQIAITIPTMLTDYGQILESEINEIKEELSPLELTLIGEWGSLEEATNFFNKMVSNFIAMHANIIRGYSIDFKDFIIDGESTKIDTIGGSATTKTMSEVAPVSNGMNNREYNFDIDTPSARGVASASSNQTHTIKDKNINQQIDLLKFRCDYPSIHSIFERSILRLVDEYTTVH